MAGGVTCGVPGLFSSGSSSARRRRLVAGISLWCALSLVPSWASADGSEPGPQSVTLSSSTLSEWIADLTKADSLLSELRSRLLTSQADFEVLRLKLSKADETLKQLETSVTRWQLSSTTWEKSSADLRALSETLQTSLGNLRTQYDALSTAWSKFRSLSETVLKRRESEVRTWRGLAIVAGVLAVVAAGVAVVAIGR